MQSLLAHLAMFSRCKVAVIGDLMLDEYLWGHIDRISPEAPVPILNIERRESTLGGAGNVAENLRSLGVEVTVLGIVGDDKTSEVIRELLDKHGVNTAKVLSDPSRKSTKKVRLMSIEHGQQVFRLDDESTHSVSGDVEDAMVENIRNSLSGHHAVICSDYLKVALTQRVISTAFVTVRHAG